MLLCVRINGSHISTAHNITVLQVCTLVGVYIPRFCYHEKLSIVGSCRMCLVELYKALKPIVACATPLIDGMDIYTETALIKNSREHILEFLLINHPLDCPICDQGGECDLQDQALIYGSDRGRFKEKKRAVLNKELGPLIKTMMTRCIHCTRCIRFMSEIANETVLGTVGRGRDMEIGTYINIVLRSEISGNIIDICPVGALTSKPFAFANRSWELRSVESIDILDSLGSSIRMDFRGSEIVRVLPKLNESINEEWITDKIRFSYDGFKIGRLTVPLIRKQYWGNGGHLRCKYISSSWEYTLRVLTRLFLFAYVVHFSLLDENINFIVGELVDLNTLIALNRFTELLGLPSFECISTVYASSARKIDVDLREFYLLNKPIVHFERRGTYIFNGSNLQLESPLLNVRLHKHIRSKKFGFFGSFLKAGLGTQLGISLHSMLRFIEGKHFFCRQITMNHNNSITWLSNIHWFERHKNVFILLKNLSNYSGILHQYNILHLDCNRTGAYDLGFVRRYKEMTKYQSGNKINAFFAYYLGVTPSSTNKIASIIYQGHHSLAKSFDNISIFLPSASFVEKTQPYVNTEGRMLLTRKAVNPPGLAKEDSQIITVISSSFEMNLNCLINSTKSVLYSAPYLRTDFSWRLRVIYSTTWNLVYSMLLVGRSILPQNLCNTICIYLIDNYYRTNVICATSKVLNKLVFVSHNFSETY